MGGGDIATVSRLGANIVALCDVDDERAAGSFRAFPKARRYKDFRVMLDKEAAGIDAVTVGTPDHIHAVAAMAAIRAGKPVYCQKPLTHTLHECRELTKAARKAGVATQMGNQGHATLGARLTNEWIQAGIIGTVREVHVWSDRAGRLWKQGIGRPKDTPPVPSTLDWNLWLGPVRERPYSPSYAPVSWRGWWDFGTGAMGDMGCHIIDHPVWALRLGPPATVESRTTLDGSFLDGDRPNDETYPIAALIYYEFPARGDLPPLRMTWYEGGLMPPAPAELPLADRLPDNGVLYVGSKGKMYHSSHGGMPQLLPRELHDAAAKVPPSIERSPGHYEEWVQACKGGPPPVSNFDYAGPLTEIALVGVLSLRAPGRRLEWDSENLKFKNAPELSRYIHVECRRGWAL
jgi:predicted dehydrogenase